MIYAAGFIESNAVDEFVQLPLNEGLCLEIRAFVFLLENFLFE